MVFRSPDFSVRSDAGNGTIAKLLELRVSGEVSDNSERAANDETVELPAIFLKFAPSGDKVTMMDWPGVISLGERTANAKTVSAIQWPTQVFVLDLSASRPLSKVEESEVASIEVIRSVLRSLTG